MTEQAAVRKSKTVRKLAVEPDFFEKFIPNAILFLLAHVVLAFVMQGSRLVATAHAYLTLGLGVLFLAGDKPDRLIYLTGYIVGADLLWRGTGARVFWEMAKYAISCFLLLSLVVQRHLIKPRSMVILYFAGLVPSVFLAVDRSSGAGGQVSLIDLPFETLGLDREAIAFNLSGPFLLMAATLYFSTIKLSREQLMKLILAILGPIVSLLTLAVTSTLSLTPDVLSTITASSDLTSADIGPNQMASMLGLGMLLAVILSFLIGKERRGFRGFSIVLAILFGVQTMLTFSRGGLWAGVGAILVVSFYVLRYPQERGTLIISGVVVILLLNFVILPGLNSITAGNLSRRLRDTDLTRRDEILQGELELFQEDMMMGVGPGQVRYLTVTGKPAHTEYSRTLAEHGLFGVFSLFILFLVTLRRVREPTPLLTKGITLSLTAWTLLFFFHSATRLAAPSFTFGLAAAVMQSGNLLDSTANAHSTDNQ